MKSAHSSTEEHDATGESACYLSSSLRETQSATKLMMMLSTQDAKTRTNQGEKIHRQNHTVVRGPCGKQQTLGALFFAPSSLLLCCCFVTVAELGHPETRVSFFLVPT